MFGFAVCSAMIGRYMLPQPLCGLDTLLMEYMHRSSALLSIAWGFITNLDICADCGLKLLVFHTLLCSSLISHCPFLPLSLSLPPSPPIFSVSITISLLCLCKQTPTFVNRELVEQGFASWKEGTK